MAEDTVKVFIGGDTEGLSRAFSEAAAKVKEGAASMGESLKSVREGIEALAVVEAFDKLKEGFTEIIGATTSAADATRKLSLALGEAPEAASVLRSALAGIGASSDTYIGALDHLGRQMKQNEDGINALGIATRNADGTTRDSQAVMRDALKAVQDYKPGLDQTQAAMYLFGRSVDSVRELMPLLNVDMEEADERTEELGLKATAASQAMEGQFKVAVNEAKEATEGVWNAIGQQLLPILTDMAKRFADAAPSIIADAKILGEDLVGAIRVVETGFHFLVASLQSATIEITAAAKIIWDALHGDWAAVRGDWQAGLDSLNQISKRYSEQIKADWADVTPKAAAAPDPFAFKSGTKGFTAPEKTGDQGRDVVLKAQLAGELAIVKEYDNEQIAELKRAYDQGLISTKDYYTQRLALAQQSIDTEIAVNKRLQQSNEENRSSAAAAHDDKGVQAALAEQIKLQDQLIVLESKRTALATASAEEMAAAETKAANDAALAHQAASEKIRNDALDAQQAIIRAEAAAGQITADAAIAAFRNIEQQRYNITVEGIRARAALEGDAAAGSEATLDELAKAYADYQKKDTEIAVEQIKQRKDLEQQIQQTIQQDFAQTLDAIVSGHKSAFDAIKSFFTQLESQFEQLASKEIAQSLFGSTGGAGAQASGGGGLLGQLFALIPGFASGTDYVPSTGLALLHEGEAVVPASENRSGANIGRTQQRVTQNFIVPPGPTYQTQNQIAAAAARGLRKASRNT